MTAKKEFIPGWQFWFTLALAAVIMVSDMVVHGDNTVTGWALLILAELQYQRGYIKYLINNKEGE